MSSEIRTKNLELNQWQGNEYLKREDLNEDNKKIDDAFGEVNEKIKANADNITTIDDKRKSELKIIKNYTVKRSDWFGREGVSYFMCRIYDDNINTDSIVDINIHLSDLNIANQLYTVTESYDKYCMIFSNEIPDNFTCDIRITKEVI